jgi:hypothetical protein
MRLRAAVTHACLVRNVTTQELVEFDPARMFFAYKNITPLFLYPGAL